MRLQGHLAEYPLRDLLAILTRRRETGQLRIDFKPAPGIFDFKDGKLISARLGHREGYSAVRLAFSLSEASFLFDTDATAPEVTINDFGRGLITNLLLGISVDAEGGCDFVHRESITSRPPPPTKTDDGMWRAETISLLVSDHLSRLLQTAKETLTYAHRHTLAASAAGILLLLVPAAIAITVRLRRDDGRSETDVIVQPSDHSPGNPGHSGRSSSNQGRILTLPVDNPGSTAEKPTARLESPVAKPKATSASPAPAESGSDQKLSLPNDKALPQNSSKVIAVVVRIEEGRVSEAYVKEHHPGLEAYEATAIRLARQRRYAKDKMGTETIVVKLTDDQ